MAKPKILVIEDDEHIRTQMRWALVKDYDVFMATDGKEGMEILKNEAPALVTLDLGLPPDPEGTSAGINMLEAILVRWPAAKVVVVTGNPDKAAALEAVSRGAHDYFTKPIDIDELKAILKRANYINDLEHECRALHEKVSVESFSEMVGASEKMQKIFSTIRKVSTTDVPVLITGESGTGKELVAKAIHRNSPRRQAPFVAINCGAIPENLLESELFGHERGAFTGAHVQRAGKIELAKGGTLFLDEIGELPTQLQVKILRFLQDFTIEHVGGRETLEIDTRVIAATNRDVMKLIAEGAFREDLYYRLAVVTIELPSLAERGDDIILLAKSFLKKFSANGARPKRLSEDAVNALYSYTWPGNVRELENKIRRAITMSDGLLITASDLGLGEKTAVADQHLDIRKAREELDIRYITKALLKCNGNISKTADELGLTRPTLHHMLKKYNISQ